MQESVLSCRRADAWLRDRRQTKGCLLFLAVLAAQPRTRPIWGLLTLTSLESPEQDARESDLRFIIISKTFGVVLLLHLAGRSFETMTLARLRYKSENAQHNPTNTDTLEPKMNPPACSMNHHAGCRRSLASSLIRVTWNPLVPCHRVGRDWKHVLSR